MVKLLYYPRRKLLEINSREPALHAGERKRIHEPWQIFDGKHHISIATLTTRIFKTLVHKHDLSCIGSRRPFTAAVGDSDL